jgi:hypothetical protein
MCSRNFAVKTIKINLSENASYFLYKMAESCFHRRCFTKVAIWRNTLLSFHEYTLLKQHNQTELNNTDREQLKHTYRAVTIQLALSLEYSAQLIVILTTHFCSSQQRAVLSEGHENQSCLPNNILVILLVLFYLGAT